MIALLAIGTVLGFALGFPGDYDADSGSYHLAAEFEGTLGGTAILGLAVGIIFFFPKLCGRLYDERSARGAVALLAVGMILTMLGQHIAGEGDLASFSSAAKTGSALALTGYVLVFLGGAAFLVGAVTSWRRGTRVGNDPWRADTLEWYTESPPPPATSTGFRRSRASGRSTIYASGLHEAGVPERHSTPGPWLRLTALAATVATGVVVVTGEWSRSHEAAVLGALALILSVAAASFFGHRDRPALVVAAATSLGLFLLQIALGGLVSQIGSGGWTSGLHVAFGALSLAACAVTAALAFRGSVEWSPRSLRSAWRDYLTLTKPRIMVLLLLTAAGGAFVGAQGVPPAGTLLAMLGGLALACGGASALNHVLDRDIDKHMKRTDRRPVATGRVAPDRALEFGLALSAFSFVVLASFTNVLAALLAVFGNLFYVLVYTGWLKRSTPQNIVIGGAAGAVPAVVGWAAVTGDLALPALFLFLIVFVWTPPHFWALAMLIRREYEAARVPMLPVVRGERTTTLAILRYSVLLVAVTLLPVIFDELGYLYLAAAVALGAVFLALALALRRDPSPRRARSLFSYSLSYLALLFVAMAIDPIVLG